MTAKDVSAPRLHDSMYEKYSRQMLFAGIGEEGQQRLLASSAVIVGCGAIGAAAALGFSTAILSSPPICSVKLSSTKTTRAPHFPKPPPPSASCGPSTTASALKA